MLNKNQNRVSQFTLRNNGVLLRLRKN